MSVAKTIYSTPGSRGVAAAAAVDGAPGVNAYTTTTAAFVMPASMASVVVSVANSSWAAIGQIIFIEFAGYFELMAKPTATSMTLKNLAYADNYAPGTNVALGKRVSPAGVAGSAGSNAVAGADAGAFYLATRATDLPANGYNLGGLSSGLLKHTVVAGVSTPGIASPTADYMPYDADLAAIASAGVSAAGLTIISAADAAAQRAALGIGDISLFEPSNVAITGGTAENLQLNTNTVLQGLVKLTSATVSGIVNGVNVDVDVSDAPVHVIRSGPTGAFSIAGLAGGSGAGQFVVLINATAHNMTILHQSGLDSTASNRIHCPNATDAATTGAGAALLWNDLTAGYWRLLVIN